MRTVIEISEESLLDVILNAINIYRHRDTFDSVEEASIAVNRIKQGKRPLNYFHMKEKFASRSVVKEFGFMHEGKWVSDSEYERAMKAKI